MLWFLKFITKAKCRSVQSSPSPMLTCTAHNNSSKITIVIITAVVPAQIWWGGNWKGRWWLTELGGAEISRCSVSVRVLFLLAFMLIAWVSRGAHKHQISPQWNFWICGPLMRKSHFVAPLHFKAESSFAPAGVGFNAGQYCHRFPSCDLWPGTAADTSPSRQTSSTFNLTCF